MGISASKNMKRMKKSRRLLYARYIYIVRYINCVVLKEYFFGRHEVLDSVRPSLLNLSDGNFCVKEYEEDEEE